MPCVQESGTNNGRNIRRTRQSFPGRSPAEGKDHQAVTRKGQVRQAFGSAAATYDQHAEVQRQVAQHLAQKVLSLPLPPGPRVLELGCGTGFVHAALQPGLAYGQWIFSDLSLDMLAKARERFGHLPNTRFVVMDAEHPCFAHTAGFDLIVSSLSFQWLEDLAASVEGLRRMLAPGGALAFSTMAIDSFHEWRAAHQALGLEAATPDYPSPTRLQALWPGAEVSDEHITQRHEHARDFLLHLKGIGAQVPAPGRQPLTAGALARVMRQFEALGGRSTYHVAYCLIPAAA